MDIPKLAERREAARLWTAHRQAQAALDAAEAKAWDENNPVCAKFDELDRQALDEYRRKRDDLEKQRYAAVGLSDLQAKAKQVEDALTAYPEAVRTDGTNENILKCGKSGEPLLENDRPLWSDDGEIGFIPEACGVIVPEDAALEDAA